jgi:hypothetical protein
MTLICPSDWWYTYPSENYINVSWDDEIPNQMFQTFPNHQPDLNTSHSHPQKKSQETQGTTTDTSGARSTGGSGKSSPRVSTEVSRISLGWVQLWPFISYKYQQNPIYRMYNPIYNEFSLVNGHNCGMGWELHFFNFGARWCPRLRTLSWWT